jgi:hypothetical protein
VSLPPATTAPPGPIPFVMDGETDFPGYRLSNPGMEIHAALRGNILYVATWAPGVAGNDHFIMIGDAALPSATTIAPWAKSGRVALPVASPFLAAESNSSYIGWFNSREAATKLARADGKRMEGSIDISVAFPDKPATLHLAALAYQTADSGILGSQAPAMVTDNGDVDPDELFSIPVEVLRDEDANGIHDRLEPGKGLVITGAERVGDVFTLTWQCFPRRRYQIETSVSLSGTWEKVEGGLVTAADSDLTLTRGITVSPSEPSRFFRVRLVYP